MNDIQKTIQEYSNNIVSFFESNESIRMLFPNFTISIPYINTSNDIIYETMLNIEDIDVNKIMSIISLNNNIEFIQLLTKLFYQINSNYNIQNLDLEIFSDKLNIYYELNNKTKLSEDMLLSLPPDIYNHVISKYTNIKDIVSLCRTSKEFEQYCHYNIYPDIINKLPKDIKDYYNSISEERKLKLDTGVLLTELSDYSISESVSELLRTIKEKYLFQEFFSKHKQTLYLKPAIESINLLQGEPEILEYKWGIYKGPDDRYLISQFSNLNIKSILNIFDNDIIRNNTDELYLIFILKNNIRKLGLKYIKYLVNNGKLILSKELATSFIVNVVKLDLLEYLLSFVDIYINGEGVYGGFSLNINDTYRLFPFNDLDNNNLDNNNLDTYPNILKSINIFEEELEDYDDESKELKNSIDNYRDSDEFIYGYDRNDIDYAHILESNIEEYNSRKSFSDYILSVPGLLFNPDKD